jgi:hypothetical protein
MTGADRHSSSDLQSLLVGRSYDYGATRRMTKTCPAVLAAKRGLNSSGGHDRSREKWTWPAPERSWRFIGLT